MKRVMLLLLTDAVKQRCKCSSLARQVTNLSLKVCDSAGLIGIVPYHSCAKGPQTFDALTANLLEDSAEFCTWLANSGDDCKPRPTSCPTSEGVLPLADCGCSRSDAVVLDFEGATMLTNNLGGNGPTTSDPQEMRFGNIGEFPAGQAFDLKIVAQDPFVNLNGYVNLNGIWNNQKFGNIALDSTGKGNEYVNEVKLNLSFVRLGSETPVVLPEFFFAVFDVDASNYSDGSFRARQTLSGKGYTGYVTDVDTELAASRAEDGSTKFTATQADVTNPDDPMTATKKQRQSMVMYFYKEMSTFEFTFGLIGDGARNFNFAGKSALMDRCGDSSSGGDAIVAINTTNPTNATGGNGTNPTNVNDSTGGNGTNPTNANDSTGRIWTNPTNANDSTGGNGSGSGNGTNTINGSFI
jgi:hypothetical protein